jgi:hypothetical protein
MIDNITDGVLLDVRGISLADLGSTALDDALKRISSSDSDGHPSFNSSI